MREAILESKCCKWAISRGWLTYKFVSPNNRGVPDRIFICNGDVVFVEFKSEGKQPTKLQQRIIDRMRQQKADVLVIDNFEDFKNAMS